MKHWVDKQDLYSFENRVYPYCYLRLLKELEDTVSFKSECDNDSLTSVISSLELVWLSRAQSSRFVLIWRVDIHALCNIGKGWTGLRFRSESEESQIMKDKWRRVQNRVESWECVIINHHGWQHYHDQVWLHESPLDRPCLWPGPVLLKLGLRHQQHHFLH